MSALREALRDLPETVFADLLESEDAYLLVIDLPGATADTIDVQVTAGRVQIEARREKDVPAAFEYVEEERALFLDAELPLPPDATGADAEGSMTRGVLELRLPKAGATPETSVPVSDADA
ncbi:MAG: Hsp20/alpha crystallin family protein [Haloarculaceae archaeon]